ncbi:MAG: LPS-assembly protein LptD [Myxococcaceae bacterium]|nr:LPS-assembly protein LptD [Myxococcaceae bacterium]
MILPAAFAVLVATGQIPLATETELPSGEKVTLAADQLLYEPSKETLIARGHTVLSSNQVTLRADEVVWDQANQRAQAKGNVMLVAGLLAAVAEEVDIDLRSLEAHVKGGLFLRKRNVTEAQLLAARTPWELKKAGETVLTITGSHIKKVGKDSFQVDDLSFTPCDCDPTEPSWRVEASRADVEMGERAILTWPVIYVYQVPVFAVPWLYLPLSDRRSGFLIPRPNFSSLAGFSLEQPLFLTAGDSYDFTLTPGFYTGGSDPNFGIKGGRLHTEFRYVPNEGTSGRATVGLLYDANRSRNPVIPQLRLTPDGVRGPRLEASWQHLQDLGNGWRDRVDAGFVSDGYFFRDVTTDVLAQQSDYLRSSAVLNHKDLMSYFGVDLVVRQPIWTTTQPFGFDVFGRNGDIQPPRTFGRFPAITWAMPERSIAGPLWGGIKAEYTRLAPVYGLFGDEGPDGLYRLCPTQQPSGTWIEPCADPGQGDGAFEPGEREARDRLDLRPQLSLPLAGRYARLTPYLGYRETVWLGELLGDVSHRGYPIGGVNLATTLVRDFGPKEQGFRHTITPEAEMRYVPYVFGNGVPQARPYDQIDAALPFDPADSHAGIWQAVVQVRQTLERRQGASRQELLRLDLGQDFDLRSGRTGDSFGRFSLRQGPLTLAALGRYDLDRRLPSQISAQLNVDDGKGTGMWLSYDRLLDVGSDPQRAGIDELVGRPLALVGFTIPARQDFVRAEQVSGGIRARFPFGLGLRYSFLSYPLDPHPIWQQNVAVSYGPGCDCWRFEVHATVVTDRSGHGQVFGPFLTPNFGASLTISQFGSFGT